MSEAVKFSEKDLKHLEEHLLHGFVFTNETFDFRGLVDRLKATERATQLANEIRTGHVSWKYFKLAYDEWRRICGTP